MRIHFVVAPPSFATNSCIFNDLFVEAFEKNGVKTEVHHLWPDWAARTYVEASKYRGGRFYQAIIWKYILRRSLCRLLGKFSLGEIVVISGESLPNDYVCHFERSILKMGCHYLFYLIDDWFSCGPTQKEAAHIRCKLATGVLTITPTLRKRVIDFTLRTNVTSVEQPLDVGRFKCMCGLEYNSERNLRVCWAGNLGNLKHLLEKGKLLQRVYKVIPFTLVVIGGTKRPDFEWGFEGRVEWFSYKDKESDRIQSCMIGIAPLDDSMLSLCKDTHKLKLYAAGGLVSISDNIGYNRRTVIDGETGILCGSDREWEDALIQLLQNSGRAQEMGAKAQKYARENFSYEACAGIWFDAIKKTASKAGIEGKGCSK